MIRRAILVLGTALVVLSSGTRSARAAQHYWPTITARPIMEVSVTNTRAGTWTFLTDDLKPGNPFPGSHPADTFMVVKDPAGHYHYNNDADPFTKASRLDIYTSSNSGTWKVTVFANSSLDYGTADLYSWPPVGDPVKLFEDWPFGGTIIPLTLTTGYGHPYTFEAPPNPGGALGTELLLYDANWNLVREEELNGPGWSARISAVTLLTSGYRLVVGAPWKGFDGSTALVANECLYTPDDSGASICQTDNLDLDGDNLSDVLEAELGTDSNSFDTDGDGLYDYYEVLGRDGQSIRDLGADPLHRDLFLEIDERNTFASPETEETISTLQTIFDDLPTLPANPDGTHTIAIHADTGGTCTDPTLCGDWGGHTVVSDSSDKNDPNYVSAQDHMSYDYIKEHALMSVARQGMFHYVFRNDDDVVINDVSFAGQGYIPGSSIWYDGVAGPNLAGVMAHELGHNFGLQHHGEGANGLNFKQNYPSLMNYAQRETVDNSPSEARFSSGQFDPLSPLDLNELSWSPGLDKSGVATIYKDFGTLQTLWETPICPDQASCPDATNPSDALDFNGDGRWTAGGVRFDHSPLNLEVLDPWPVTQGVQYLNGTPDGGIGLAFVNAKNVLYAFGVLDGEISDAAHVSGGWYGWDPVGSSLTPSATGEVAAVAFPQSGANRVVVVFPDAATNHLDYMVYDVSSGFILEGPIPGWPTGVTARQAGMAIVNGKVMVVFRDNNGVAPNDNQVWISSLGSIYTWSAWELASDSGGPIRTTRTPGIVVASDGNLYLAAQSPNADPVAGRVKYYARLASSAGDFTSVEGVDVDLPVPTSDEQHRTRLNLLFLPYLHADATPFADESGYLALIDGSEEGGFKRFFSSGYIETSGANVSGAGLPRWQGIVNHPVLSGTSMAVVREGDEALAAYLDASSMVYIPHADGIPATDLGNQMDVNDAAIIDQHGCDSLWAIVCPERCTDPFTLTCTPANGSPGGEGCVLFP